VQATDVIAFWLAAGPKEWFAKSDAFDAAIRERFEAAHHAAARGEFSNWEDTADGALGLLLLLDQFPRNLYRGSGHAFATDPLARAIAQRSLKRGFDREVPPKLRPFFYLPYEHSESLQDQERCVALCREAGDAETLRWAELHRDIIVRFGRFPHRNAALGRETTPEEYAFLADGGFAG
jgi:uncharacterized protein (DUF924 family)